MEARFAPYFNQDRNKIELKSDFNMCSPADVRIVQSIKSLNNWIITKKYVKAAFIQTVQSLRYVFV